MQTLKRFLSFSSNRGFWISLRQTSYTLDIFYNTSFHRYLYFSAKISDKTSDLNNSTFRRQHAASVAFVAEWLGEASGSGSLRQLHASSRSSSSSWEGRRGRRSKRSHTTRNRISPQRPKEKCFALICAQPTSLHSPHTHKQRTRTKQKPAQREGSITHNTHTHTHNAATKLAYRQWPLIRTACVHCRKLAIAAGGSIASSKADIESCTQRKVRLA